MRWAISRTVERRATRMHQMMERLHVDVLALVRLRNGEAYAEARSKCLCCDDSSICLLWLDKGGPDAGPDFCPNFEFFGACACRRGPVGEEPKPGAGFERGGRS